MAHIVYVPFYLQHIIKSPAFYPILISSFSLRMLFLKRLIHRYATLYAPAGALCR